MLDITTAAFWIAVADHPDRHPARRRQCRGHRPGLPQAARRTTQEGHLLGRGRRHRPAHRADLLRPATAGGPWLKIVGALLLFWIGVKLLLPEDDAHGDVAASTTWPARSRPSSSPTR
jgi:hypothetical protein